MNKVTVFCGSSTGTDDIYEKQAYLLGQTLAKRKIGLVYGGTNVGLMGVVADGTLAGGGEVIGVLPLFLKDKGIAHENLTELIFADNMHERKTKMNELSDGVIALPGGFGTMEEFFEMLTWGQLGLHRKPVALLNVNGYFDSLKAFVQTMVDRGFLKKENQEMLIISSSIDDLLEQMKNYIPPAVGKWFLGDKV